jgi:hypothetical protein
MNMPDWPTYRFIIRVDGEEIFVIAMSVQAGRRHRVMWIDRHTYRYCRRRGCRQVLVSPNLYCQKHEKGWYA